MGNKSSHISFPIRLFPLVVFIFMLPALLASCFSQRDSIYEGQYSTSFEVSVFHPCGAEYEEGVGYADQGYWLTSTNESGFNNQLQDFHSFREPTGALNLYVKFVGSLSPTKKNGYGHLGMYSNEITIKEVLDMKPWDETDCQSE